MSQESPFNSSLCFYRYFGKPLSHRRQRGDDHMHRFTDTVALLFTYLVIHGTTPRLLTVVPVVDGELDIIAAVQVRKQGGGGD